jgi:hypothetical protein
MDFDTFMSKAWEDHATDAAGVATILESQGLARVNDAAQLARMANLAHHVFGAHLARWQEGLQLQQQLAALPCCTAGSEEALTIARHVSALRLAGDLGDDRPGTAVSDQIRLTAMAASNLVEHDATRAATLLEEALALTRITVLPDTDPAHRVMAVVGNNIAATLEEKSSLTTDERRLMILAAQTGRHHWAIAGTWLETERAEYRLALCWLKAGDNAQARQHAQKCLEIVMAHGNVPLEAFFGWVALGLVERAAGNASGHAQAQAQAEVAFAALEPGDRGWCQASLDKLSAAA